MLIPSVQEIFVATKGKEYILVLTWRKFSLSKFIVKYTLCRLRRIYILGFIDKEWWFVYWKVNGNVIDFDSSFGLRLSLLSVATSVFATVRRLLFWLQLKCFISALKFATDGHQAVVYPEFSKRAVGCQLQRWVYKIIIRPIFFPKLSENKRNWTNRGAHVSGVPRICQCQDLSYWIKCLCHFVDNTYDTSHRSAQQQLVSEPGKTSRLGLLCNCSLGKRDWPNCQNWQNDYSANLLSHSRNIASFYHL